MELCRWNDWITDVVQSKWNLIVVGTLFLFWMLLFLLGGKAVFGEAWETLSLTRVVRTERALVARFVYPPIDRWVRMCKQDTIC